MPIICFDISGDLEDKITANKFFKDSQERLRTNPLMTGKIKYLDNAMIYIIYMKILTPPYYHYLLISVAVGWIINIFWLFMVGLILWCISFFFWECPLFMELGLKLGLKKAGFKGKIKILTKSKSLERLVLYGSS